jgi:two-component system LytT family sensor kinase
MATPRAAVWGTPSEWGRLWMYGFVAYTALVIFSVESNAGWLLTHGQAVTWGYLVRERCLEEYTCAVFVPPLFLLVRRWPIDRQHWRRSVPVLVGATLLFVLIKYAFLMRPLTPLLLPGPSGGLMATLVSNTAPVLLDFWSVIGVAHAFEFYRRAQDKERVAVQLRAQLSQAQLEALRSQLQPHFLFNTLNSVATLVHRDADAADRMVTDLADLLRATLGHQGSHEVTLGEELSLLERYVAIARSRFRDRLTVSYEVPADLRSAMVPQFLLQPLVENALEHGVGQRPGPGRLEISVACVDGQLRIAVCDDGPGLRASRSAGHGVGLTNTRARLAGLYGSAQCLTVESASAAGGVRATVVVPFRVSAVPTWQRPSFERA